MPPSPSFQTSTLKTLATLASSPPLLLTIFFFTLFFFFASFRSLLDGRPSLYAHEGLEDDTLHYFSWIWGLGCGFLRLNPGSAISLSAWAVSLSLYYKNQDIASDDYTPHPKFDKSWEDPTKPLNKVKCKESCTRAGVKIYNSHIHRWYHSTKKVVVVHCIVITVIILVNGILSSALPSWLWHPATLFFYTFHPMPTVASAMKGLCKGNDDERLCLSDKQWNVASNALLSAGNGEDLKAVVDGLEFAGENGLIINILARDVAHAIPTLIENIDILSPYFANLAVVVFENDSIDGSRDAFKSWSSHQLVKGNYQVDLLDCSKIEGQNYDPDCHLKEVHRYDKSGLMASSIGRMAVYRNYLNDYIISKYPTSKWSHMLVTDLDLQISLSPLGVLHSLSHPDKPIVARGVMVTPGALGTLYSPYDFSAFRAKVTKDNWRLRAMHQWFVELAPMGSRWRNNADVMSPFNTMNIFALDFEFTSSLYPVQSAFHGATLYPYNQLVLSRARYDDGGEGDGQRCEHIGFNIEYCDQSRFAVNGTMMGGAENFAESLYINPKWTMHLNPQRPGGPTGWRFASILLSMGVNSQCVILFVTNLISQLVVTSLVAVFIIRVVHMWEVFVMTLYFKRFATFVGLNVNHIQNTTSKVRKNTGDDGEVGAELTSLMEEEEEEEDGFFGEQDESERCRKAGGGWY